MRLFHTQDEQTGAIGKKLAAAEPVLLHIIQSTCLPMDKRTALVNSVSL